MIKTDNPAVGVDRYQLRPRDRFLRADEMPAFLDALECEDELNHDFFRILLLTGVRKGNLMAARWKDISLSEGLWKIEAEQSKNGRSQFVRLAPPVVAVLERRKASSSSQFVFAAKSKTGHITSPKKAWARVTKRAGIENLCQHDLRRTNASWQLAAGATLQEVGKSLNHRDIKSTLVYAHLELEPVKRNVDSAVSNMLKKGMRGSAEQAPANEDR